MTYSIAARCPTTGAMGVAVQTHWFGVGANVPMIEPGVGAVATQSVTSREAGRVVLANLRAGENVTEALENASATDEFWNMRQIGVVDWRGEAASHTGSTCVPYAGGVLGNGVACQANFMEKDGVPEAMLKAWDGNPTLDIADRLLAALLGAESKGGDIRGRQSAAILVYDADTSVVDPIFNLRIDDHHEPLVELARLVRLSRAYQRAGKGRGYAMTGDTVAATDEYSAAMMLAPESEELVFWHGLVLAKSGDLYNARLLLSQAFEARPQLRELLPRLGDAGWIGLDEKTLLALMED